MLKLGSCFLQP